MDNTSSLILRTNPKLTTNVKITVTSDGNIQLNSFDDINPFISNIVYKHFKVKPSSSYEFDLYNFWKKGETPLDYIFDLKKETQSVKSKYEEQYSSAYNSGAKLSKDNYYSEEFSFLAPLMIKNKVPEKFVIFKVPGPLLTNTRNDLIKNIEIIKTFDLTESNVGKYLNNYISQDNFKTKPLFVNYEENNFTNYNGISIKNGGFVSNNEYLFDNYKQDKPIIEFEKLITLGFERKGIAVSNILNLEFLFDDTSDNIELNRYFGLYVDKFEDFQVKIKDIILGDKLQQLKLETNTYIHKDIKLKNSLYYCEDINRNINIIDHCNEFQPNELFIKTKKENISNFPFFDTITTELNQTEIDKTGKQYIELLIKNIPLHGNWFSIGKNHPDYKIYANNTLLPNTISTNQFSINGTITEVINSIVICINNLPDSKLRAVNLTDNKILVFNKIEGNSSFVEILHNPYILDNSIDLTNNKFITYNAIHNVIAVSSEYKEYLIENKDKIYIKTINSYSKINNIYSYLNEPIYDKNNIEKSFNNYNELIVLELDSNVYINKFNKIEFLEKNDYSVGRLSIYPVVDFDFDFFSEEYNYSDWDNFYIPLSYTDSTIPVDIYEQHLYTNNSIYPTNKLVDNNENNYIYIFNLLKEIYNNEINGNNNSIILTSIKNSLDTLITRFKLYTLNSFGWVIDIDYIIQPQTNLLKFNKYINNLINLIGLQSKQDIDTDVLNEYDRLKENYTKEFSYDSKITPYINKWVKDEKNVKETNYRLNTNLSFGVDNFSPSYDIKKPTPQMFTHEWYYLGLLPTNEGKPLQTLFNNYIDVEYLPPSTIATEYSDIIRKFDIDLSPSGNNPTVYDQLSIQFDQVTYNYTDFSSQLHTQIIELYDWISTSYNPTTRILTVEVAHYNLEEITHIYNGNLVYVFPVTYISSRLDDEFWYHADGISENFINLDDCVTSAVRFINSKSFGDKTVYLIPNNSVSINNINTGPIIYDLSSLPNTSVDINISKNDLEINFGSNEGELLVFRKKATAFKERDYNVNFKKINSYFETEFDIEKYKSIETDYFLKYFTIERLPYYSNNILNYKYIKPQYRYSTFEFKNKESYSETFFRGIKLYIKEINNYTDIKHNLNSLEYLNTNKFDGYKFSSVLQPIYYEYNVNYINKEGLLTDKTIYDGEKKDFSFYATDTNEIYIKNSNLNSDWNTPIYFLNGTEGSVYNIDIINDGYKYDNVEYKVIKNDKFKTVTFLINIKIPYIKNLIDNKIILDYNLLYNLKDFLNIVNSDVEYLPTPISGAINLSSPIYGNVYKGILNNLDSQPNFLTDIKKDLNGIYNTDILIVEINSVKDILKYQLSNIKTIPDNNLLQLNSNSINIMTPPLQTSDEYYSRTSLFSSKGGLRYFEHLFELVSFAHIYDLVNSGNPLIKYININTDGIIQEGKTDFVIEFEKPDNFNIDVNLNITSDNEKPDNLLILNDIIGFNIIEDIKQNININRYKGFYEPKLNDVISFNDIGLTEIEKNNNLQFDLDDIDFGFIKNLYYNKTNSESSNIILNTNTDNSVYPLVNEISIEKRDMNIFLSNWNDTYFIKHLDKKENIYIKGSYNTLEDKSFFGSKLMLLPETIIVDEFDINNIIDLSTVNQFKINIDLHEIIINKFVTLLEPIFDLYIDYNFIREKTKYDFIKNYINNNILARYSVTKLKLWKLSSNSKYEFPFINTNLTKLEKIQLNYEIDDKIKTNFIGNSKINLELINNIDKVKKFNYFSLSFQITKNN